MTRKKEDWLRVDASISGSYVPGRPKNHVPRQPKPTNETNFASAFPFLTKAGFTPPPVERTFEVDQPALPELVPEISKPKSPAEILAALRAYLNVITKH